MANIYMRRKFCEKCGSTTKEDILSSFDKQTGERNTRDICSNPRCEDYCDFHNKHEFNLFGFGATCKNCGYIKGHYL